MPPPRLFHPPRALRPLAPDPCRTHAPHRPLSNCPLPGSCTPWSLPGPCRVVPSHAPATTCLYSLSLLLYPTMLMPLVPSLLLPLLFPGQITLSGPCTLLPPPRPLHPPKLMFPPMLLSHPRLLHAPRLLSPPRLLLYPRLLSSCPLTLPGCFPSQVISRPRA